MTQMEQFLCIVSGRSLAGGLGTVTKMEQFLCIVSGRSLAGGLGTRLSKA